MHFGAQFLEFGDEVGGVGWGAAEERIGNGDESGAIEGHAEESSGGVCGFLERFGASEESIGRDELDVLEVIAELQLVELGGGVLAGAGEGAEEAMGRDVGVEEAGAGGAAHVQESVAEVGV